MGMYKTVYPGVYNDREKRLLDEANARLQAQIGQPSPFGSGVADPTLMKLYNNTWDPWNPLFNDPGVCQKHPVRLCDCYSLLEGAGGHVPHAAHGLRRPDDGPKESGWCL